MNKLTRTVVAILVLVYCVGSAFVVSAENRYKSFVDEQVYASFLFEEDPTDEFLAEKREINRLCAENEYSDEISAILYAKVQELNAKETARYGEIYRDLDVDFVITRMASISCDAEFKKHIVNKFVSYGEKWEDKLREESTWKEIESEIESRIYQNFKGAGGAAPPELNFRTDKAFVEVYEEFFGNDAPVALRHKIKLIQDYSVLGDSKFALKVAQELLPKLEAAFGANSAEVVELLNIMAYDYKTLGNYRASEETLLKAIAINRELYGEESSLELVKNLVALANLRKATPNSAPALYDALDKAAKNLPEAELHRSGYFRISALNNFVHSGENLLTLTELGEKESAALLSTNDPSRNHYVRLLDIFLAESESEKLWGYYARAWDENLRTFDLYYVFLGKHHHTTLAVLYNLSDDYLRLNQPEEALTLARSAFETSRKIYGDEHPCTVYAIHALTNVYRQQGNYAAALELDEKSYAFCQKIFVGSSAGEPQEILTVLMDIADDYKGLKKYPAAIKFYEDALEKCRSNTAYTHKLAEVQRNLASLYNLSGEYEKTVALYDFLKQVDGSYSLDDLPVYGLTAGYTAEELGEALSAVGQKTTAARIYHQEIIKFEEARLHNTESTDENRREWFAQTVPYYKKAAAFFVSQNQNLEAFRAAELCKGRILADNYRDFLAAYKSGISDEEISKLHEHREKIFRYKNKFGEELQYGSNTLKFNLVSALNKIMNEYGLFMIQLGSKYPRYRLLQYVAMMDGVVTSSIDSFLDFVKLKELIPRDHCYISYSVVKKDEASNTRENEILAFVADETGEVKSFSIPVDEKFFAACQVYHDLLEYPYLDKMRGKYLWKMPDGSYFLTKTRQQLKGASVVNTAEGFRNAKQELAELLGEKLLAPLTQYISTKKTWIISPDGELNLLPFETLNFNGRLAVETADICYVPSLAVLKLMKEAGEKNSALGNRLELFAMGNAEYGSVFNYDRRENAELLEKIKLNPNMYVDLTQLKWRNVAGTGVGLEKVSALFPANTQKMLTGAAASERNLKQLDRSGELGQYRRILFGAHGLFIPERPDLNSIVLSQGLDDAENDGYVTVGEIFGYKLHSDLVYLSACESGRGDYHAGEGIIGLPYALTVAGNKDTVMSLWEVDDKATAEFTAAVFEKLSRGESEVRALNETKREFLKNPSAELNSSSVWAAFLLYGF